MSNFFSTLFYSRRRSPGASAKENKILLYLFAALLVVLQLVAVPYFEIKGVGFNLIVVFLLVWLFYSEGREVVPLFVAGILMDLFSAERFGVWTLTFVGAMLFFNFMGLFITNIGTLISKSIIVVILTVFCVFIPVFLQQLFILIGRGTPIEINGATIVFLLFEVLFNLVIYAILKIPTERILERINPKRVMIYK